MAIGLHCYFSKGINEEKKEGIREGRVIAALMPFFITTALTSVATGIGLAITANAIFPGVMLGMGSAALASGVIGAIAIPMAVIAGIIVTVMFAANLAEYVIKPDNSLNETRVNGVYKPSSQYQQCSQ